MLTTVDEALKLDQIAPGPSIIIKATFFSFSFFPVTCIDEERFGLLMPIILCVPVVFA